MFVINSKQVSLPVRYRKINENQEIDTTWLSQLYLTGRISNDKFEISSDSGKTRKRKREREMKIELALRF